MEKNFTEALIDRILSDKEFDNETIEAAKVNIADTIVCGILGKNAPGILQLINWVDSLSASGSSTIWGIIKKFHLP